MDPNLLRTVKHSFVGKMVRSLGHLAFRLRFDPEKPLLYHLARNLEISLYPQGEVPEFLFLDKSFERTECDLVAAYLKPGMNVIDVGANVGLYSILADKLVAPGGKIWAFEPSSETYQWLLRNVELNRCSAVIPHKVALCDVDDQLFILRSDRGYGDAYRYLATTPSGDHSKRKEKKTINSELVPVFSLDRFAEHQVIKKAHLIKVDIEGGEYCFFQGARRFLQSNQDVLILFENSPDWAKRAGYNQTDVWTLLKQLGFEIYAWDDRHKKFSQSHSELASAEMLWACRHSQLLPEG